MGSNPQENGYPELIAMNLSIDYCSFSPPILLLSLWMPLPLIFLLIGSSKAIAYLKKERSLLKKELSNFNKKINPPLPSELDQEREYHGLFVSKKSVYVGGLRFKFGEFKIEGAGETEFGPFTAVGEINELETKLTQNYQLESKENPTTKIFEACFSPVILKAWRDPCFIGYYESPDGTGISILVPKNEDEGNDENCLRSFFKNIYLYKKSKVTFCIMIMIGLSCLLSLTNTFLLKTHYILVSDDFNQLAGLPIDTMVNSITLSLVIKSYYLPSSKIFLSRSLYDRVLNFSAGLAILLNLVFSAINGVIINRIYFKDFPEYNKAFSIKNLPEAANHFIQNQCFKGVYDCSVIQLVNSDDCEFSSSCVSFIKNDQSTCEEAEKDILLKLSFIFFLSMVQSVSWFLLLFLRKYSSRLRLRGIYKWALRNMKSSSVDKVFTTTVDQEHCTTEFVG